MAIKYLKDVQSLVREEAFELLNFSVTALTGDEEITQGIDAAGIPSGKRDKCKQYLSKYTSVKNSEKLCFTVKDPLADREQFDGLWRCIRVDFLFVKGKEFLVRILRKGYLTAIDWSEARLVEGKTTKGASREKFRIIRWLNCAPTSVEAMVASLSDATYANKKVSGQTLSGTWYNIYVAPSLDQEGSGVVTLYLGIPQVVKEGIVTSWNEKFKEWIYIYDGYTETQADTLITTINAGTPPVGWTYNAQPQPAGEGLWNVIITKQQIQEQTIAEYDSAKAGTHHETKEAVLNTTNFAKLPIAVTAGEIQDRAVSKKDDGSMDIHKDRRIADDIETAEYDDDYFINRETAEHTANETALAREDFVSGEAIRIINSATEYPARYRTRRTKEKPTERTQDWYVVRYGERSIDSVKEVFFKSAFPPSGNDFKDDTANGTEYAISNHELDKFGLHSYRLHKRVRKYPFSDIVTWTIYGDYSLATSQVFSETLGRYWNDKTYVYQDKITYTKKYFKTETEAIAYIGGTFLTNNSGSHHGQSGEFEWYGIKVVHTKSLVTTYPYEEPTS